MTEQSVERVAGVTQYQIRDTFDLAYIFKNGWNSIYFYGNQVSKVALSLMTISFSIGALGFLFVLGRIIYAYIKKEENDFKLNLSILLITSVQYLFMSRFALGYDGMNYVDDNYSYKIIYLLGWGGILITIGFFVGLTALFLYDFDKKESVLNKTSICTRIASVAIFFVGLYGLTNMVSLGVNSTKKPYNSFSFISYLNNRTDNPNFAICKALAIIAIIIGIISFIGVIVSAFFYIKGADSEKEKKITNFSTISFVSASLTSNIFMLIAGHLLAKNDVFEDIKVTTHLGFTFIVSIVLGIALILLVTFAQNKLKIRKTK